MKLFPTKYPGAFRSNFCTSALLRLEKVFDPFVRILLDDLNHSLFRRDCHQCPSDVKVRFCEGAKVLTFGMTGLPKLSLT